MSVDLDTRIRNAAPTPRETVDFDALVARGRRHRAARVVAVAGTAVVVALALAGALLAGTGYRAPDLPIVGTGPEPPPTDPAAELVHRGGDGLLLRSAWLSEGVGAVPARTVAWPDALAAGSQAWTAAEVALWEFAVAGDTVVAVSGDFADDGVVLAEGGGAAEVVSLGRRVGHVVALDASRVALVAAATGEGAARDVLVFDLADQRVTSQGTVADDPGVGAFPFDLVVRDGDLHVHHANTFGELQPVVVDGAVLGRAEQQAGRHGSVPHAAPVWDEPGWFRDPTSTLVSTDVEGNSLSARFEGATGVATLHSGAPYGRPKAWVRDDGIVALAEVPTSSTASDHVAWLVRFDHAAEEVAAVPVTAEALDQRMILDDEGRVRLVRADRAGFVVSEPVADLGR